MRLPLFRRLKSTGHIIRIKDFIPARAIELGEGETIADLMDRVVPRLRRILSGVTNLPSFQTKLLQSPMQPS